MRVVGYAYEADCHCTTCASVRFPGTGDDADENGVSFAAVDNEGNPIRPIFSTDEGSDHCGDCNAEIK